MEKREKKDMIKMFQEYADWFNALPTDPNDPTNVLITYDKVYLKGYEAGKRAQRDY